jgi:hypothetical protein
MRRYNIVTGILLILSIDFALTAPVLVQEKRQARVDVVHMPKDVITVLEKRWDPELERLGDDLFGAWERPVKPPGQPPAPNPAASTSTANPESSCVGNCFASTVDWMKFLFSDYPLHDEPGRPRIPGYGTYEPYYQRLPVTDAPVAEPFYRDQRLPMTHAPQPEKPWIHPSADPNFDWEYWLKAKDPPPSSTQKRPPTPPTITEEGQASGYAPGPPPGWEMHSPSPGAGSQTDPAANGKAKESRRISDTARDAGNVAVAAF